MKKRLLKNIHLTAIFSVAVIFVLALMIGCAASGSKTADKASASGSEMTAAVKPMTIPESASCGKCGMYPAKYPRWQSQIIFKDGTMTPFDGCKCMFNFMAAMDKYDNKHSGEDLSAVLVKDFNSGKWLNAQEAYYVVGSNMMGPMGKELIPFADHAEAKKFHGEQGGTMMKYADITPEVLETLGMGGMKKHMKM